MSRPIPITRQSHVQPSPPSPLSSFSPSSPSAFSPPSSSPHHHRTTGYTTDESLLTSSSSPARSYESALVYCLSHGPLIDESIASLPASPVDSHSARTCISRLMLARDRCVSLCEQIEEMQRRLALYQTQVEQCQSEVRQHVAYLKAMRKNQRESDLKGGPSTSNFKTAAHLPSTTPNEDSYHPSVHR